jgi:stage II sporulation protein M
MYTIVQYSKTFFKSNRVPFILSMVVYFIGFLLGMLVIYFIGPNALNQMSHMDPVGVTHTLQGEPTTLKLIQNNCLMILILLSGSFLFGLSTLINMLFNGYVFGMTIVSVLQVTSLTKVLLLTVPHAIIELPATWFAGAAGFKIPYELVLYLADKKNYIFNKKEITDFLTLATIAILLIIVAAFVEANITTKIAEIL